MEDFKMLHFHNKFFRNICWGNHLEVCAEFKNLFKRMDSVDDDDDIVDEMLHGGAASSF